MSRASAERRLTDLRRRHGEAVYTLAVHASLGAAVDAELLHHLRDNFLLDLAPPQRLPATADSEAQMGRLLLSPLFAQIDDDLYEMDRDARELLVNELAAIDGGQRLHDVAYLLERYTRERSGWQSWPELANAQLLTAYAAIDPQSAREWLDAGRVGAVASGASSSWYVAMRERLDGNAGQAEPAPPTAHDADVAAAVVALTARLPGAEWVGVGVRLTASGLVVAAQPMAPFDNPEVTTTLYQRPDEPGVRVSYLGGDKQRDLSFLLESTSSPAPAAPLASDDELRVGDPLIILGFGGGLNRLRETTTVTQLSPAGILLGAAPGPSSSGSAIVGPSSTLVGIYVARSSEGAGLALPVSAVVDGIAAAVDPAGVQARTGSAQDAALYLRIASASRAQARFRKAEQWADLAISGWQALGDVAGLARAWIEHAQAAATRDAGEAERSLTTALKLIDDIGDDQLREELASTAAGLGPSVLGHRATEMTSRKTSTTPPGVRGEPTSPPELTEIAGRYRAVRQLPSGPVRTREMDHIVADIRALAPGAELTEALTRSSDPGLRLAAVVSLQDRPRADLLEWLGERLSTATDAPYVGYQAAVALRNAAEYLEPGDLTLLESACRAAWTRVGGTTATDRGRLLALTLDLVQRRRRTGGTGSLDPMVREWALWPDEAEIRVSFVDNPGDLRPVIESLAHQWTARAGARWRFLPGVGTGGDVRISTPQEPGLAYAYAGTEALNAAAQDPTMVIPREYARDETHFRRATLKMFGHALGLINEHQSPRARLPWDVEAVYRHFTGAPYHYTREAVDQQWLRRFEFASPPPYRPFDELSVMLHEIPAALVGGRAIGGSSSLSESDVAFVAELYPRTGGRWWQGGSRRAKR